MHINSTNVTNHNNEVNKFSCVQYLKSINLTPVIPAITDDEKLSLCIIYAVWSKPEYIEFLYWSIYSQFKYTDAYLADIKIFTEDDLFDEISEKLSMFPVEVISISSGNMLRKYSIVNHPSLQEFKQIVLCDCDTFFYSPVSIDDTTVNKWFRDKRTCLYSRLEHNNKILMLKDNDTVLRVFLARMKLSPFTDVNDYLEWFKIHNSVNIIENLSKSDKWYLSCFMSFPTNLFTGHAWNTYCKHAFEMSYNNNKIPHSCDETIFLTFSWKHNYEIRDITESPLQIQTVYSKEIKNFLHKDSLNKCDMYILHPLHGWYAEDPKVKTIFEQIFS